MTPDRRLVSADSPFTQKWEPTVNSYFQGDFHRATRAVEEAEGIMPGFADLMRLRIEAGMRGEGGSGVRRHGLAISLGFAGVLGLALLFMGVQRAVRSRGAWTTDRIPRVSPAEVQTRLETGAAVALVDARQPASFCQSPFEAVEAIRYDVERPSLQALHVQVVPTGEVIAYCDCTDEATSTQVALQLLQAGYRHVAVVRGGFQGLIEAGVAMVPKDVTPTLSPAALTGSVAPPTRRPV